VVEIQLKPNSASSVELVYGPGDLSNQEAPLCVILEILQNRGAALTLI
jgi:hypothetical protein